MRTIALAIALVVGLILPAFAQKAEIEAVNAKWIDLFNKGDFAGVASLYTDDATAFPPGSGMVKGRAAIEALWKNMAEQASDPKLTTLDVKPLGPSAAREIGTFSLKTKGPMPKEVSGKYLVVWEKIGSDWKLAADIWNDGNRSPIRNIRVCAPTRRSKDLKPVGRPLMALLHGSHVDGRTAAFGAKCTYIVVWLCRPRSRMSHSGP